MVTPRSLYQDTIRQEMAAMGMVGRHDPAVVEAWMRSQNWIVANLTLLRGSSSSEVRRVFDAVRGDRDLGGRWQPR